MVSPSQLYKHMSIQKTSALPVVTGQGEVESAAQVKVANEVYRLGTEMVKALGVAGEKYRDLCMYIRDNKVDKKIVARELGKLGIKRSRVSMINRIAFSSDKVWKEYEAKLIGFHEAVDLARMEDGKLVGITPAAKLLADAGSITPDEGDEIARKEATPGSASGVSKVKSISEQIKRFAMSILKAGPTKKYARFVREDSRFEVIVQRIEKTGPSLGD